MLFPSIPGNAVVSSTATPYSLGNLINVAPTVQLPLVSRSSTCVYYRYTH